MIEWNWLRCYERTPKTCCWNFAARNTTELTTLTAPQREERRKSENFKSIIGLEVGGASEMLRNVRDVGAFIGILIYVVSVASFTKIVSRAEPDELHVPRG